MHIYYSYYYCQLYFSVLSDAGMEIANILLKDGQLPPLMNDADIFAASVHMYFASAVLLPWGVPPYTLYMYDETCSWIYKLRHQALVD